MYQERAGAPPGSVVWTAVPDDVTVVVPDGCMDLIAWGGRIVVAGPDTRAHVAATTAGERLVGLRLPPGLLPRLLGVPAAELVDSRVELSSLGGHFGRTERRHLDRAAAGAGPIGSALEAFAVQRLAAAGGPDPVVEEIVRELARGAAVGDVAERTALGSRGLHRLALGSFGYGPQLLRRIIRLQAALARARSGSPAAAVAAEVGYADQPHLVREARALTGRPFGALVGRTAAVAVTPGTDEIAEPAHSAANRSTPLPSGSWTTAYR